MLMAAGTNTAVTGGIFGPIVNALLALGLFLVMLVVLRSRRPRLGRAGRAAVPPAPAVRPKATPGDETSPVCGETPTGR